MFKKFNHKPARCGVHLNQNEGHGAAGSGMAVERRSAGPLKESIESDKPGKFLSLLPSLLFQESVTGDHS